ncbi:MAG: signal peptidase I [Bacilli bacterium]|jgi:signal peptidase|nr:signal peptidase I [Bacilli bacterium]
MMKKIKELRDNKTFKIIKGIIKSIVVILLIGFIIVVCLQRVSNNRVSFFNYRMFIVVSGSMKPKYDIGDVLISKEVVPSKIKVGDTISYLGKAGNFRDKVITHQVIRIETDETGKYLFHAKGLANLVEDPIVGEDQLYGVVIYKSFVLSLIYRIISTSIGFYLFIIIPLIYIIGSEIIMTLLEKEEKRREKTNEKT